MDFKGLLMITDLDDTAFDSAHRFSEKNLEAVLEFIDNGGQFAVATGRGVKSVAKYNLPINAPSILYNGTIIYDFETQETLWRYTLRSSYKELLCDLLENFPGLGAEWVTMNDHIVISDNDVIQMHLNEVESISYLRADVSELGKLERPLKFMFGWDVENLTKALEHINLKIKTEKLPFKCNFSYPSLMELTDINAGKGVALRKLSYLLGIPPRKMIALGDSFSDLEMITNAGIGFAVGNSSEGVKNGADAILRDCNSNAIEAAVELIKKFSAFFSWRR
jgi:Cof subfamily protein (haloacid dehalogenase superfamily)